MSLGFIVLRHVNSELSDKYWIKCYDCIRKHYPENEIIIIDDNSNYEFITDKDLYKTLIINSEYHKRGELLPYYYYLHNKLFDTAVILHDSVFLMRPFDFKIIENIKTFEFLWHFDPWKNIPHFGGAPSEQKQKQMIYLYNDNGLNKFFNSKIWNGCFGGMTIITYNYLVRLNNRYDISKLLNIVLNRSDRECFERVIACLLVYLNYDKAIPTGTVARKKFIRRNRHGVRTGPSRTARLYGSVFGDISIYSRNSIIIKKSNIYPSELLKFLSVHGNLDDPEVQTAIHLLQTKAVEKVDLLSKTHECVTFENWFCYSDLPAVKIWSGR